MTDKELLELAAKAGNDKLFDAMQVEFLQKFAELVRADERDRAMRENAYVQAEREACAEVADYMAGRCKHPDEIADAIRARSTQS